MTANCVRKKAHVCVHIHRPCPCTADSSAVKRQTQHLQSCLQMQRHLSCVCETCSLVRALRSPHLNARWKYFKTWKSGESSETRDVPDSFFTEDIPKRQTMPCEEAASGMITKSSCQDNGYRIKRHKRQEIIERFESQKNCFLTLATWTRRDKFKDGLRGV